jgi:hypothetical protein
VKLFMVLPRQAVMATAKSGLLLRHLFNIRVSVPEMVNWFHKERHLPKVPLPLLSRIRAMACAVTGCRLVLRDRLNGQALNDLMGFHRLRKLYFVRYLWAGIQLIVLGIQRLLFYHMQNELIALRCAQEHVTKGL